MCILADLYADALSSWDSVQADDGSTAADLAARAGAHHINAMIQRKMDGLPSGLETSLYQFDPETGELIDDACAEAADPEATDSLSDNHRSSNRISGMLIRAPSESCSKSRGEVVEHSDDTLSEDKQNQSSENGSETADSQRLLSSPRSDGYDSSSFVKQFPGALYEHLPTTLLKRNHSRPLSSEDEAYLEQKVCNSKDVPRVFDLYAAMLSSVVVGAVGMAALGLRFCLERYGV